MEGTIRLRVERAAALGDGLGRLEGKSVFIPFAAPGELVRATIVEDRGDYARARLVEVLEPSPDRVEPLCPLYGACGGCSLQHLSAPAQRELRAGILREALGRGGEAGEGLPGIETVEGPAYRYRNRFRFTWTQKGPGLLRAQSDLAIHLPSCPLAAPEVNEFLSAWTDDGQGGGSSVGNFPRPEGGERRSLYGSEEGLFIEGRDSLACARVAGKLLSFPTDGFFQSNLSALESLIGDLLERVGGESILDLYGGVGTFSAFLSERASRIVLVEEQSRSARMAQANVGNASCKFSVAAMRVEEWIGLPGAGKGFDAAVLDPPRTGLSPKVRAWLAASGPPLLAYVSCDAATLARDIKALRGTGYALESLRAYDFYPQTARLECLAILARETR
jgi:23S rRNA (uracil1939-C5)-methyltransferase